LIITALHPAERVLPPGHVLSGPTRVIDIADEVPGLEDQAAEKGTKRFLDACELTNGLDATSD
jgi:hypothetical protein